MGVRPPIGPVLGSLLFLVVVPGTVAGWIPYWLTEWRIQAAWSIPRVALAGWILVVAGMSSLLDSFLRFASVGLGTPAPIAPPTQLVVSGQYRHVRNPMYVAILTILVGQALILRSGLIFRYAALVWLGFHVWVLLYEEPRLSSRFGQRYAAYRGNVGRWWPRLRPWTG